MKLYALRIFVRDWKRACAFYRDTLGLDERFKAAEAGWAEYDVGGPCFGVERIDPDDPEAAALTARTLGVSLQVDDIEAVYAQLRDRGVDFLGPPEKQFWGGTLAHFRDPENNVLTLLG